MYRDPLQKQAATNSLGAILEAILMDVPGKSGIHDFQKADPEFLSTRTKELVPQIMARYPMFFPREGILRVSGGRAYLSIADQSNYTVFAATTLGLSERLQPGLPSGKVAIVEPPTALGTHIALASPVDVGRYDGALYPFRLDWKRGIVAIPASSQPVDGFLPLVWYVLYVDGLPSELVDPTSAPHIPLAVMASVPQNLSTAHSFHTTL